ncbi:MAG: LysR family transcriptional regulator [Alphaproteobacteria bacterium]|nr:LysR family transcriptional regulator [Alphaproteobacteria bacterium]
MELYLLRTFVTVAAQGHLTKAGALLHLSQPAVSGQIKALEDQLELKLFERGPSGMRLTKAGEALLPQAKAVVTQAAEFRKAAKLLKGHLTGKARIGTILDPVVIRLGPLASTLQERHPWLDVRLQHGISTWAAECVSNGALDGAFSLGGGFDHGNLRVLALEEVRYRVVAPAAWAAKLEGADLRRIASLPWVRPPRQSPHQQMAGSLFEPLGLHPATVIEADQESSISTLVKAGIGLGLMREDLARAAAAAGEVCVWKQAAPSTQLSFIYARGRDGDTVIAALLEAVVEVWHLPQAAASIVPLKRRS